MLQYINMFNDGRFSSPDRLDMDAYDKDDDDGMITRTFTDAIVPKGTWSFAGGSDDG